MSVPEFKLTRPCGNCPFRTDVRPYISAERVEDILEGRGLFYCHKTVEYGEDDEGLPTSDTTNSSVCAGFLICKEHDDNPNQMMRIAERLGLYDRTKLHMDSPVYGGQEIAIEAHKRTEA